MMADGASASTPPRLNRAVQFPAVAFDTREFSCAVLVAASVQILPSLDTLETSEPGMRSSKRRPWAESQSRPKRGFETSRRCSAACHSSDEMTRR